MARPGRPTPGPWPGGLCLGLLGARPASEGPNGAAPPAVVFDWMRNGNRDIYRAALDGRDVVRLTSDPGDDQHPTERAGAVVFTSYRDGHAQLYAVAATGGGTARRLTNTAFNETQPALSPDGTKIAYLTDSSGVPKLWLCAADGSGPGRPGRPPPRPAGRVGGRTGASCPPRGGVARLACGGAIRRPIPR